MARSLLVIALAASVLLPRADNPDEACFRRLLNAERTSRGIPALTDNATVDQIARRHSQRMAADGTIYHANDTSPHYHDGDALAAEYDSQLGGYAYGGENVGMGSDCPSVHQAFMNSPAHRANILDRHYTQVGVGVAYDADHTLYVTEDFYTPEHHRSKPKPKPKPTGRCVS